MRHTNKKAKANRDNQICNGELILPPLVELNEKENHLDYLQQVDRDKKIAETKTKFNLASYATVF